MAAGGGTEALIDLGSHCQHSECNQLDFLPFICHGCQKVFCLEHRSYKSHNCPESDRNSRKVTICEICSTSMETTGCNEDEEKLIMEKHVKSADCIPEKKKKARCGVRLCKEILTFSNTSICKTCHLKVCLKHRFPADHQCTKLSSTTAAGRAASNKFLLALASRCANDSAQIQPSSSSKPNTTFSVKVF